MPHKTSASASAASPFAPQARAWHSLRGWGGAGRFVPALEPALLEQPAPLPAETYEAWLRRAAERDVATEINAQLGQLTLQRHSLSPLPS